MPQISSSGTCVLPQCGHFTRMSAGMSTVPMGVRIFLARVPSSTNESPPHPHENGIGHFLITSSLIISSNIISISHRSSGNAFWLNSSCILTTSSSMLKPVSLTVTPRFETMLKCIFESFL